MSPSANKKYLAVLHRGSFSANAEANGVKTGHKRKAIAIYKYRNMFSSITPSTESQTAPSMNWCKANIAGNNEKSSIERSSRSALLTVAAPATAKTDPAAKLASAETHIGLKPPAR